MAVREIGLNEHSLLLAGPHRPIARQQLEAHEVRLLAGGPLPALPNPRQQRTVFSRLSRKPPFPCAAPWQLPALQPRRDSSGTTSSTNETTSGLCAPVAEACALAVRPFHRATRSPVPSAFAVTSPALLTAKSLGAAVEN